MTLLRLPGPFASSVVLVAVLGGCAARQEGVSMGGPRDERRDEIARLDRRIADEEVQLGMRPAPTEVDAEADATAGSAAPSSEEEPPPALQAPSQPTPAPPSVPRWQPSPPSQLPQRFAEPPSSPPSEASCQRVCRSVAAICDASRRICRLADGLDDDWADGRCQAATRSCTSADRRAQSSCAGSCG